MSYLRLPALLALLATASIGCTSSDAPSAQPDDDGDASTTGAGTGGSGTGGGGTGGAAGPVKLRIGHFNIRELSTDKLLDDADEQVAAVSQILARFNPDILNVNEIQYDIANLPSAGMPGAPSSTKYGIFDGDAQNARRLADRAQAAGADPWNETLIALGNSGYVWEGDDLGQYFYQLRGWGEFKGRFNTALISRHPILRDQARIVTDFAWEDLPGNSIAKMKAEIGFDVPAGFPLFEKGLHVVPIDVAGTIVHFVLLHPVSPAFDPINPYRNRDELHALALFLDGELPDVEPLPEDAKFVIVGDLNADPENGDGIDGAIAAVIEHPKVLAHFPEGPGGHGGYHPERNTFLSGCGKDDGTIVTNPEAKLQLQLDYVLPSKTLGAPIDSAVFFPDHQTEKDDYELACRASDHRFVWADFELP